MGSIHNSSMYFESKATDTKKIFKITFPHDVIFSLRWPEEDIELLKQYESSDKVSDRLQQLVMIAKKIEERGGDNDKQEILVGNE